MHLVADTVIDLLVDSFHECPEEIPVTSLIRHRHTLRYKCIPTCIVTEDTSNIVLPIEGIQPIHMIVIPPRIN